MYNMFVGEITRFATRVEARFNNFNFHGSRFLLRSL